MEIRPLGTRYMYNRFLDTRKHVPYDASRFGLLNKMLPPIIYNTTNKLTQSALLYIEGIMLWVYRYVDRLRAFKAWNYNYYTH